MSPFTPVKLSNHRKKYILYKKYTKWTKILYKKCTQWTKIRRFFLLSSHFTMFVEICAPTGARPNSDTQDAKKKVKLFLIKIETHTHTEYFYCKWWMFSTERTSLFFLDQTERWLNRNWELASACHSLILWPLYSWKRATCVRFATRREWYRVINLIGNTKSAKRWRNQCERHWNRSYTADVQHVFPFIRFSVGICSLRLTQTTLICHCLSKFSLAGSLCTLASIHLD